MNRFGKIFGAALQILAGLAVPELALAQITLNGTVPTGRAGLVIIQQNSEPESTGVVEFKFSAPGPGGGYVLGFCIGPASNPCGMSTSYVVNVPDGQSRLAVVSARTFEHNELVVAQGTNVSVPFSVEMQ